MRKRNEFCVTLSKLYYLGYQSLTAFFHLSADVRPRTQKSQQLIENAKEMYDNASLPVSALSLCRTRRSDL